MECKRQSVFQVCTRDLFTDVRRFRWVACQLDSLGSCLTLLQLRKALATLPRTLNDTYAHILCNIEAEHQQYALHLLQLLAFSARPLKLEEMAEVLTIDVNDTPNFDPQRRLADSHDVVEMCSSLVTVTSSRASEIYEPWDHYTISIVTLAHFSVREYLASEVTLQEQTAKYRLQSIDCNMSLAQDCLPYLLHLDVVRTTADEVWAEYPLYRYAAEHWTKHAQVAEQRDSTLCKEFFLKREEGFFNWVRLGKPDNGLPPFPTSPENFASSLYYASLVGLFEIVKTLCDMGADVNAVGGNFETALIATSCNEHIEMRIYYLRKVPK